MHLQKPLLLAHRGSSLMAPENTIPAFDFGLQHGVNVFEIDVRLSFDHEVIVIHDDTVDRTTDGSGSVNSLNLKSLKRLDGAYRFKTGTEYSHRGNGVKLITLGELYEQYPSMIINIDIKDNVPQAADAVLQVITEHSAASRTVVASFHDNVLHRVRELWPELMTGACPADIKQFYWRFVTGRSSSALPLAHAFQLPRRYGPFSLSSRGFISAIHRAGRLVHFWTINDPATARMLLARGADGIVTDRADLLAPLFSGF